MRKGTRKVNFWDLLYLKISVFNPYEIMTWQPLFLRTIKVIFCLLVSILLCWKSGSILILEYFCESYFFFLGTLEALSLGVFWCTLSHDIHHAGSSGGPYELGIHVLQNNILRLFLWFCYCCVCFWNYYGSDIKPSELVLWCFGFFYLLSLALWSLSLHRFFF